MAWWGARATRELWQPHQGGWTPFISLAVGVPWARQKTKTKPGYTDNPQLGLLTWTFASFLRTLLWLFRSRPWEVTLPFSSFLNLGQIFSSLLLILRDLVTQLFLSLFKLSKWKGDMGVWGSS